MTKIFNQKRKSAFTLAEVLITLTIIGVIAAATIPTLMQKHLEQEMVAKLKKTFSVLNNAYLQAIRENGSPDEWDLASDEDVHGSASFVSSKKLFEYLSPYLKVQKICGKQSGCFATGYKRLFGNEKSHWWNIDGNGHPAQFRFTFQDGTSVSTWSYKDGCQKSTNNDNNLSCGTIFVDVNGKKGPNRLGVDLFYLVLTGKNILPLGLRTDKIRPYTGLKTAEDGCIYNEPDIPRNGSYCGVHVLYKGNMDYLHRDISSEWQ